MKKISLLAGAVCTLVLLGCSPSVEGGKSTPKLAVSENDLTIDGVKIPGSGTITIPAGTVTGNASYSFEYDHEGVFSVEGRNLTIPAFEMGQYEVTQRLYKAVMSGDADSEAEPSYCKGDSNTVSGDTYIYSDANADEKDLRPVEGVTWYDAVYFCNKLSEKTGKVPYYTITGITIDSTSKAITSASVAENPAEGAKYGYRLPTEAEWEYAARGGNPSATGWNNFFAGKASSSTDSVNADLDSVGWYWYNTANNGETPATNNTPSSGKTGYGTHRVGLKDPVSDSWKLYDMSGNVLEWCWDWYDDIATDTPLAGPSSSTRGYRVYRGGGWNYVASNCSVANRGNYGRPDYRYSFFGFRVVCSAQ